MDHIRDLRDVSRGFLDADDVIDFGQANDRGSVLFTVERQEQALLDAFGAWWAGTAGPRLDKPWRAFSRELPRQLRLC